MMGSSVHYADLKSDTGAYIDVMSGLSQGKYSVKEAAETLSEKITGVLGYNAN